MLASADSYGSNLEETGFGSPTLEANKMKLNYFLREMLRKNFLEKQLKFKFLTIAYIGVAVAFFGGGMVFTNINLYWIGFPMVVTGTIIGGIGILGGILTLILE